MFLKIYCSLMILFKLLLRGQCEYRFLEASSMTKETENTAECVLILSAKYFVEKKALSGSIVIININSISSTTEQLLLRTIHSGIKYSIMVKDSFYRHANASHFPEKAKNYMLILEEKTELNRNILQLNKLPTWNPHAKAIVLYALRENELGSTTAIGFINELRSHKLFKVIVFIIFPSGEIASYTWRPYSHTNCAGLCRSVFVLDRCKDNVVTQFENQTEVVPSNLRMCPLVVRAVVSEPYVMPPVAKLQHPTYSDAYEFDQGAEINLVKIISQFTNMSLIVRMSSKPEDWGTIHAQGNATGAYGMLQSDSVDLVIGNIEVTRIIRQWFDPTVSYTQDEMTWCVPKAGQASTWNNLVNIFQWSTWLATFVMLIAMGLLFHYFYYTEHDGRVTRWPTNSLLMTLSMLLGWGSLFHPKSMAFRIMICGWLGFSLNMGISYESFLRSFLMHPRYERQISSEAELIRSNMAFGGRATYRPHFETNNASLYYLYRKYNSCTFTEGITRAAISRNFAVVSSKRQAEFQDQLLGKGAKLLSCFPERNNLYKYGVVLLARKWFPMTERFNLIIRSVAENGLIQKWIDELFILSSVNEEVSSIEPLGIQHLVGAFMFIGLMYGTSVAVLFAEILWHYVQIRNFKICKNFKNSKVRG